MTAGTAERDTAASQAHRTTVTVRGYEIDALGHVAHTVYLQYAEHARWECLAAAGLPATTLLTNGVMPVMLETTISYRSELRYDETVEIGCEFTWGEGKTARIVQPLVRASDGVVAAQVSSVAGLMDLARRRLVAEPRPRLRELAARPELLGV
ncbi:MAG: thioesterase [Pseudonocardia sp. SCN 72-86]|nr:MAG: thioesterase [Pseudonocardia sp. SCN 72-86]